MIRQIIQIDEEKCDGCGLCVDACHEGAIGLIHGKAKLLRDDHCDGLGDCLPLCPQGAISFTKREAAPYDEYAVSKKQRKGSHSQTGICSETKSYMMNHTSSLRQWPVQIKLAPVKALYFENADLLISADCCAYAHGNFHRDFMCNKVTLIGCPKLDSCNYSEKLAEILRENDIKSLSVVKMEVPCCGGIEKAAAAAFKNSGKIIPFFVTTISTQGEILHYQGGRYDKD